MNTRLQALSEWLDAEKLDAAFINTTENVFYLTNFHSDPHERLMGLFVFPKVNPFMVVPGMEVDQVKAAGWSYDVIGYHDHEDPWQLIKEKLDEFTIPEGAAVALEKDGISFSRGEAVKKVFGGAEIVSAEDKLNSMRVVKSPAEIAKIREAAALADYGVKVGVEALTEGVTELEVVAKIEYELKKKGIQAMSFSTMVLFGEKSGVPHGTPGDRKLKAGDLVLFDLGVVLDGYCSDITRTFAFRSVSEDQQRLYHLVLQAQLASLSKSKPGTRIGDLDLAARDIIREAGYGDYFPHRIGHGMGINVHEFPSMSHLNDGTLLPGMIYTIEPGVYLPDLGGVRIEDDVLITEDGYELLTKYPKELQIIS